MNTPASLALNDLQAKVQSIALFAQNAVRVVSIDEAVNSFAVGGLPSVALIYEGLRSQERASADSHRAGLMCELMASLYLVVPGDTISRSSNNYGKAVTILDQIRDVIKNTKSPTGHFWRFVLEAQAIEKGGTTVWGQRWATPFPIT